MAWLSRDPADAPTVGRSALGTRTRSWERKGYAVDGRVIAFLLATAAFIAIVMAAWVVTVGTIGQRERRRHEEERSRQLQLEEELRELGKQVQPTRDNWLLDAQGMEVLRSPASERYPPLTGGQTPEEFWAYWAPDRLMNGGGTEAGPTTGFHELPPELPHHLSFHERASVRTTPAVGMTAGYVQAVHGVQASQAAIARLAQASKCSRSVSRLSQATP